MKTIAGVDEVGRGSLIGPVYAAAVILNKTINKKLLKDSKSLKKNKQVTILVMDSFGINKKNPYKFSYVKKKINESLSSYKNQYIILKIPVVSEVVYGRKVGYNFRKIKVSN